MSDDDSPSFGLVMPFVVCSDQGGPYDPGAFVAGCYFGELGERLKAGENPVMKYVPTPLVPQLDLLAMQYGYQFKAEAWAEHPDEWTEVRFWLHGHLDELTIEPVE